MLLPLVVAALLGGPAAAPAAAQGLELPNPLEELPVIPFTRGERLEDLPGRSVLSPTGLRDSINITLEPATLVTDEDGLQFTNGFYRDGESGGIFVFGPTLRIKAGEPYWIYLANNMYIGPNSTQGAANTFRDPAYTNLHTHGLHDSPGAFSQDTAEEYQGSDNIFVSVPGKLKPSDEPARLAMNSSTPPDHMPGLHWYHPHYHGSSMLQTSTANGLIIVEDDEAWLPAENGCTEVWDLMQEAPDQILHLALLTFADPAAATLANAASEDKARMIDANYQYYSEHSQPSNVYCCNETNADNEASLPLLGSMSNDSFVLVNGGYEPVVTMQAGRYQRWRLVNTGYKALVDLVVLDPATLLPTNSCDLQLLAKDGVYLMEIPRKVDHIFLVSGNRAELLIKCEGEPGDRFIVASGAMLSPFGRASFTGTSTASTPLEQPVVMTIELSAAEGPAQPQPKQKACTPLRPGYAPDLRDPALKAAGATDKLIKEIHGFVFTEKVSCTVDGEAFAFPDPEPLLMPLGSVVEWQYWNITVHPMHLHVNPFQIVELPKNITAGTSYTSWFEEGDYQDTIVIPLLSAAADYVGLRIQPGQFAGYSVLHCHLLQHEDKGCMKVVRWQCPGYNETQPYICRDYEYPVPATYTKGRPFDWAPSPAAAPTPALASAAAPREASVAMAAVATAAVLLLCAALLG